MKINFKILKSVLCILMFNALNFSYGQQDPQYTQYLYNTMTINPAYTGSKGHFTATTLARVQWIDVPGAPRTISIGAHNTIKEYSNMALGVSIIRDDIGPVNETYLDGNFSYTLRLGFDGNLAFGAKAGARFFNSVFSEEENYETDFVFQNVKNKVLPTVGAGVYYYSEKFYAGLSVPNFILNVSYKEIQGVIAERLHFFLIAGYVLPISENIKFKPALLARSVSGSPLSADISGTFLVNDKFYIGASYRIKNSANIMAGFQISKQINLGYSYDLSVNEFSAYNNGSHEFFLTYDFFRKRERFKSPRFF